MELMTISEISKSFHISTRTLRYYEEIGLIQSVKKDDYAYRTYDEATITRLQQILVLRKLRIPLKQIGLILQSENTAEIIETFRQNLNEVDDEITALSTIRDIIGTFIERLNESIHQDIKLSLLDDTALLEAVDALTVTKSAPKEEKTAADLEKASAALKKFDSVQYINLPPARAVAFDAVSKEPEDEAMEPIFKWIKENDLEGTARYFLYNIDPYAHQTPDGSYGMGCCATIPKGIEIPEHFYERELPGGVYVVSEWKDEQSGWETIKALMADPQWEWEYDGRNGCVGLEEHIRRADGGFIINIMLPIKEKKQKRRLWSGRKKS